MNKSLADIARDAKTAEWMRQSFSVNSKGQVRPLTTSKGYCCAWAAECLGHAFSPHGGPNLRHRQTDFSYFYNTAHDWAAALRKGGDCDIGTWLPKSKVGQLRPGDMIFWMQGVNGYKYPDGHVAIGVGAEGAKLLVSENSSSRGIGTHSISTQALRTMAGVMRWNVGAEPRPLLLQMADSNKACPMRMEGDKAIVEVRELEKLGFQVRAEHLKTHRKIYLVSPK